MKNDMSVQKLAQKHFDEYVGPLLKIHGEDSDTIIKCRFHYVTAAVHFAKHVLED